MWISTWAPSAYVGTLGTAVTKAGSGIEGSSYTASGSGTGAKSSYCEYPSSPYVQPTVNVGRHKNAKGINRDLTIFRFTTSPFESTQIFVENIRQSPARILGLQGRVTYLN
ncbi:unannotated protein [freshwater metagenome]|uniref:Unannotated protein n=1 Tax=freshwater metagenome TaxID=449393 RepID=A0A6J7LGD2_9ZZZZ